MNNLGHWSVVTTFMLTCAGLIASSIEIFEEENKGNISKRNMWEIGGDIYLTISHRRYR